MSAHPFTERGLGQAPFSICAEGSSGAISNTSFFCEYCGVMLKNRHFVRSADGVVSVVGIDCLAKVDGALALSAKNFPREQARQQKVEQAKGSFEQRFNKSFEDALKDAKQQLSAWLEQWESFVYSNFGNALSSQYGEFASNMYDMLFRAQPLSRNMASHVTTMLAKHLSKGARKNSARFNAQVGTATSIVSAANAAATQLAQAIKSLEHMELVHHHYGICSEVIDSYQSWLDVEVPLRDSASLN